MQDYPPNSAKARARAEGLPQDERPERIERVTSAEAVRRKRGLGRQFRETFIGGTARGAWDYMLVDVVIPAIQDTLIDAFQGGIERLIKGESRRYRRYSSSPYSQVGHVNYQGMSTTMNRPPTSSGTRMLSRQARARHDFGEIVIGSRTEANEVIDRMYEFLDRYGVVRVSELYEMTDIPTSHTDQKWGWTSLSGAKARRLRTGGFMLDLPEPQPL